MYVYIYIYIHIYIIYIYISASDPQCDMVVSRCRGSGLPSGILLGTQFVGRRSFVVAQHPSLSLLPNNEIRLLLLSSLRLCHPRRCVPLKAASAGACVSRRGSKRSG